MIAKSLAQLSGDATVVHGLYFSVALDGSTELERHGIESALAALGPRVNFGISSSPAPSGVFSARYRALRGLPNGLDYFVIFDGDGEEDAQTVFKLVTILATQADTEAVVSVAATPERPLARRLSSRMFWVAFDVLAGGGAIPDQTPLRAYRGYLLSRFVASFVNEGSLAGAHLALSPQTEVVKINRTYKGRSSFDLRSRFRLSLQIISESPTIVSRLSFFAMLLGSGAVVSLVGAFLVYRLVAVDPAPGYTSFGLLVAFSVGMQILLGGVLLLALNAAVTRITRALSSAREWRPSQ